MKSFVSIIAWKSNLVVNFRSAYVENAHVLVKWEKEGTENLEMLLSVCFSVSREFKTFFSLKKT